MSVAALGFDLLGKLPFVQMFATGGPKLRQGIFFQGAAT